jgi:poly-gamma-glutamate synthesis protein (capsule biosynthesis protein)
MKEAIAGSVSHGLREKIVIHTVLATGDLAMDRDDYDACFAGTADLLQSATSCLASLKPASPNGA